MSVPSKNTVRKFEPDQMYHIYNRGVEKRPIFLDERDHAVFLSYLKFALTPREQAVEIDTSLISNAQRINLRRLDLASRLDLVAFCLMPNHFHLLVYQHDKEAVTALMRSLATGYSMYFNNRYKRVGSLFQGKYKASLVSTDSYRLHISRYIHLNPLDIGQDYTNYNPSSFKAYTGQVEISWLRHEWVTNSFDKAGEYQKFVAEYIDRHKDLKELDEMLAD